MGDDDAELTEISGRGVRRHLVWRAAIIGSVIAPPALNSDGHGTRLPLALRAWAVTRHLRRFRGQARLAVTLAGHQLEDGVPYRSADGLVLEVDPTDDLQVLMLLGMYDRHVLGALRQHSRPGAIVVDAGGHIGYFSLHAARGVGDTGEVHAFECDPRILPRLKENLALNRAKQVHLSELALSDSIGELELGLGKIAMSTIHSGLTDGTQKVVVPARPLDDYLAERRVDLTRISLIKVDVEGAEAAALRGMRRTIEGSDAAVIVEVDPARAIRAGDKPEEVFELLDGFGRRPAGVLSPRGPGPIRLDGLRSGESAGAADVLFVPG